MKIRSIIGPALILGLILSLVSLPRIAVPKTEKQAQEQDIIVIPPEVKTVLQEGLQTRQARMDIPFTVFKYFYLPARENFHSIFLFKIRNVDLGFSPVGSSQEGSPAMLQSQSHVFLQFNRLENNTPGELIKEVYAPAELQEESASYEPDKENIYSIAYPLPPGNYLMSMAVASSNLEKIGTQYFAFSLLDPTSLSDRLETTPIFFVKSIERMASPETKVEIHKGIFTWSALRIEPNTENVLSAGENLDVFFYVIGAKPSEEGKFNVEISFEVLKGDEKLIRFANATYDFPLISQPLPLKQTVVIKSGEGEEKRETRDLEPGKYSLSLSITDKVSGDSVSKSIDFEVKE